MSELSQNRKSRPCGGMPALPLTTDIVSLAGQVRFVQTTDLGASCAKHQPFSPSRAIIRSTVVFDQAPPRGDSTPCSVSALAIAREDCPAIDPRTGLKASSRVAAA